MPCIHGCPLVVILSSCHSSNCLVLAPYFNVVGCMHVWQHLHTQAVGVAYTYTVHANSSCFPDPAYRTVKASIVYPLAC